MKAPAARRRLVGAALGMLVLSLAPLAVRASPGPWPGPGAPPGGFPPGGSPSGGSPSGGTLSGYPWWPWPPQGPPGKAPQPAPPGGGWPQPGPPSSPTQYPDGFPHEFRVPLSRETGRPVSGWGCDSTGKTDGGPVRRVPVLFVHGTTRTAHDWDTVRKQFLDAGYTLCETWAVSYGYGDGKTFESNDRSAPTIGEFVDNMIAYLRAYRNANVTQVDIVAHSLGGTVVRKWLKDSGAYGKVRSFISIASPHHGAPRCPDRSKVCQELDPDGEWLKELNAGDETPGDIRYMTIYDGTGYYDYFYDYAHRDSPALDGATNHPYNVEHGTRLDHAGLKDQTVPLQLEWLKEDRVPSMPPGRSP